MSPKHGDLLRSSMPVLSMLLPSLSILDILYIISILIIVIKLLYILLLIHWCNDTVIF